MQQLAHQDPYLFFLLESVEYMSLYGRCEPRLFTILSTIKFCQLSLVFRQRCIIRDDHNGIQNAQTLLITPDRVIQSTAYQLSQAGCSPDNSNSANPSLSSRVPRHAYLTSCIPYSRKRQYPKAGTEGTSLPPPPLYHPNPKSDRFHLPNSQGLQVSDLW